MALATLTEKNSASPNSYLAKLLEHISPKRAYFEQCLQQNVVP